MFVKEQLIFLRTQYNTDVHKYVHTLTPINASMQTLLLMSTTSKGPAYLEVDEVTTDASLLTDTSLPLKEKRWVPGIN
jgi:hypothetical protein